MDRSDVWAMQAATKGEPDWSLDLLIRLIEDGSGGFPLTVLVHGMFIRGLLVNSTEWADHLDGAVDDLLGGLANELAAEQAPIETVEDLASTGTSVGDIEERRAAWPEKGWRNFLDERRADRADAEERLQRLSRDGKPAPFETLPEDLAELAVGINLPKVALTLKDATIISSVAASPVKLALPYVRVIASSVDAWWPGSPAADADPA